jgi:hypothetical protein
MASTNVVEGAARLKAAMKSLQEHWLATEATWSDSVRQRFEERYILPMDPAAEAAINGMRKLAEVLEKVRRDCSDRSEMP